MMSSSHASASYPGPLVLRQLREARLLDDWRWRDERRQPPFDVAECEAERAVGSVLGGDAVWILVREEAELLKSLRADLDVVRVDGARRE